MTIVITIAVVKIWKAASTVIGQQINIIANYIMCRDTAIHNIDSSVRLVTQRRDGLQNLQPKKNTKYDCLTALSTCAYTSLIV